MGFTMPPFCSILTIFYENGSLDRFLYSSKSVIASNKRLIIKFAAQVSEAISVLHQNGFAHCDLKPHNVLIDIDSTDSVKYKCRLADFGLTQPLDDSHAKVKAFEFSSLPGMTTSYAAPEAIKNFRQFTVIFSRAEHFKRRDIYSLAVMFYELSVRQLAWSNKKL
jgi:serine/threonine protein kinase